MKIAIIGTGNIGSTLARKLVASGHHVTVANSKGIEGVRQIAADTGAHPADVVDAVEGAQTIILAIPTPAVRKLPPDLFKSVSPDTTVIDTSNYYPAMRDTHIPDIDNGMTESVWVSLQIGFPVIKAFKTALAYTLADLGQPEQTVGRIAIAVAGDDSNSKDIAMQLVSETGFDPVDTGSLEESWRQQPCTPAYCCDYDADTMRTALASAIKGVASKKRDKLQELMGKLGPSPSHDAIVAMNRTVNAN